VDLIHPATLSHWVPKKYSSSSDELLRTEQVHGFGLEKGTEKLKTKDQKNNATKISQIQTTKTKSTQSKGSRD